MTVAVEKDRCYVRPSPQGDAIEEAKETFIELDHRGFDQNKFILIKKRKARSKGRVTWCYARVLGMR